MENQAGRQTGICTNRCIASFSSSRVFVYITEPCFLYLKHQNSGILRQTSLDVYCMRI